MGEGKELFDAGFSYVDRPTEVEAYGHAVEAARRIGMIDQGFQRLAKVRKVRCSD